MKAVEVCHSLVVESLDRTLNSRGLIMRGEHITGKSKIDLDVRLRFQTDLWLLYTGYTDTQIHIYLDTLVD